MLTFRINAMGIQDIASVVEHDVTSPSLLTVLPAAGTVDMITMSYSFTMIPDQKATIANCTKLVKKGGHIGIADFFQKGNFDDCLSPLFRRIRSIEAFLHKTWFSFDHVHLLADAQVEGFADLETVWDNRFRGSIPFMPFFQPYHGVYIMRKVK